jgi:hypothetical protein
MLSAPRTHTGHATIPTFLLSALVACVCALGACLALGTAPSLAASAGGGVFGPLVAPGVSPALVGGGDSSFGEPGEGAGQIGYVEGLAVDHATGDVYVDDAANRRIDEFDENGKFVRAWGWGVDKSEPEQKLQECTTATGCQRGEAGGGAGELNDPAGIAVDGEVGGEAVYVLESGLYGNDRVQEFAPSGTFVTMWGGKVNKNGGNVCAVAEASECQAGSGGSGNGEFSEVGFDGAITVGPTGLVYVGDYRRVQWFSPAGKAEGSFSVTGMAEGHEIENVEALAVTSGGSVCLTVNPSGFYTQHSPAAEVLCYSATGTLEHSIALEEQNYVRGNPASIWLAADGAGHLFVDQYLAYNASDETVQAVYEYNEAGQELARLLPPGGEPGSSEREPGGFALSESGGAATGLLVASESEAVVRSEALAPGPVILGESGESGTAGCLKLMAVVDPEGAQTKYKFVYGTESPPGKVIGEATMVGEGFKSEKVSVTECRLAPEATYNYFVVAENINGGPVDGQEQTVVTAPALKIDGLWSAEVSEAGASLEAEINPTGVESEYRFEYAPVGGAFTATASEGVGAGSSDVRVAKRIGGLTAHTTYIYRLVGHNGVGTVEREGEFLTRRGGAPPPLLDNRIWEQVSPAQKHSAAILLQRAAGVVQAAPVGGKITYYAATASEASPAGEPVPTPQQIISTHDANGGWQSKDIVTPNSERAPELKTSWIPEYWFFSSDLERSVSVPNPLTALSQWTVGRERTPYVRDESKCPTSTVSLSQLQASECFTPLLTDSGPFSDVSEAVKYGGPTQLLLGLVSAVAVTPDLSHVVLRANGAELLEGAGPEAIYEWDAGNLALISQNQAGNGCKGMLGVPGNFGELGDNSRNALAPDGSLAVWGGQAGECAGHLYVRDMRKGVTAEVDEVQGGSGAGGPGAVYEDASVGDKHIFFTDSQRLTADSTGAGDLYEYAFDPVSDTGSVVDMSVPVHAGEAAGVEGVLGVAEDGSRVYAVAKGVLTEEANMQGAVAQAGGDNLYQLENVQGAWRAKFIAKLSSEDASDWRQEVGLASARVSPDGQWLAFMSDRSLTGYDNRDRVSGVPDQEAFLFGAGAGRLVCASCNPTGARPAGMEIPNAGTTAAPLIDSEEQWRTGQWLAGVLPVSYSIGLSGTLTVDQPRYLSDGGRLFFDSTEALVPQDSDGTVDVYEYEPPPGGDSAASDSCSESSVTFSAAAGGCVGLVSGGDSSSESVLVEASENGNDVFFESAAKLAGSDTDTSYDVYDAHSCGVGASWVCSPPPAVSAASCESASACKTGGTSVAGGAGALASEAVEGIGNFPAAPVPVPAAVKPKPLTRAERLEKALRVCHKKANKRSRTSCEKSARKRYGPVKAMKKVNHR